MTKHSGECAPNEGCGILYGHIKGDSYVVQDVKFVENTAKSSVQFTMKDADVIEAYNTAQNRDTKVIGIYHSHPASAAVPSGADKKYMEINPIAWIIHSGINQEFRAWYMSDDIYELSITVLQNKNSA